jgi:hypothetical protein
MNFKKILFKIISYGLVSVAVVYFGLQLNRHLADIPPIDWSIAIVLTLVLSIVITALNTFTIALNWRLLLRDQDVHVSLLHVWQMVAVSQIGKYLPGNVGHFAGRAVLGKEQGIPLGVTVATTSIETIWNVIVGAALTLLALALGIGGFESVLEDSFATTEMLVALLLVSVAAPTVGIMVMNRVFPRLSLKLGGGALVKPPRVVTSLVVGGIILFNLFVLGAVLKLQATSVFQAHGGNFFLFALLFSVAWIIGYLVPGSPGGMGVREAMMLLLFTPVIGAGATLGISVTMRVTSILGDGLAFLMGMVSLKMSPPPVQNHR